MYYYPFLSAMWRKFFIFGTNAGLLPFGNWQSVFGIARYWPQAIELPFKQAYRRHNAHVVHRIPSVHTANENSNAQVQYFPRWISFN
ncbi:uncharacterized protein LOC120326829 isoform X2 [Styela clava]